MSEKSICTVCNYIYDAALGEPRLNVPPYVVFEELPAKFRCPECGSDRGMFQPCTCVPLPEESKNGGANNARSECAAPLPPVDAETKVGEVVAERPWVASILEEYGIDYCCGGSRTLAEVATKAGLPVAGLLDRISRASLNETSLEPDWTKVSLNDLSGHIIRAYHTPLCYDLPRIMRLAEKVASVHGEKHPEMIEVRDIFAHFKGQLELHMQKEEMILFPAICKLELGEAAVFGCGGGIEHPIEVMLQEHDDAGQALERMRSLTGRYTAPEDACNTFKILLYCLARLESEMHHHVHKENNILFPRALALSQKRPVKPPFACR